MTLIFLSFIGWNIIHFYEKYNEYQIYLDQQLVLEQKLQKIQHQNDENNKLIPIFEKLSHRNIINHEVKGNFYSVLEKELLNADLKLSQINISPIIKSKENKSLLVSMDYVIIATANHEEQILLFIKSLNLNKFFLFNIERVEIQRIENSSNHLGNLEVKCFIKLYTYVAG